MFTIRFHGRGGQGMKTASHFLGNAFFLAGYEVQDAPRYGAERRGAPMTSYVRTDHQAIYERGILSNPGLVVVADDSLIPIAAAGVMKGISANSVLLIVSHEKSTTWQHRLNIQNSIKIIKPLITTIPLVSAACAGAAACLTGSIDCQYLLDAIREELSGHDDELIALNINAASQAYEAMLSNQGIVKQTITTEATNYKKPDWIDLPLETADISAPIIHAAQTSIKVRTGLWRIQRPIINYDHCNHCWWICSTSCPDGVINIEQGNIPVVDYDHCKGCMICVAQCPAHAIEALAEADAQQADTQQEVKS